MVCLLGARGGATTPFADQRTFSPGYLLVRGYRSGFPSGPLFPKETRLHMKKGVPVSPGVVVAHAWCVDEVITSNEPYTLEDSSVAGE